MIATLKAPLAWLADATLSNPRRTGVIVVAALAVLIAGLVVLRPFTDSTITITARFQATPGLYVGNRVAVLGVAQGEVTRIEAHDIYVAVTMAVPKALRLPADVHAIVSSPNPVSDRNIELYPAYDSGPTLDAGATIPVERTATPLSVDTILANIDELARTLGPDGANKNGALSSVVSQSARLLAGNGAQIRTTLDAIAQTLPSLIGEPGQVRELLTHLDRLTTALAAHDSTLDSVLSSVTTATTELADQRGNISAAITNLGRAMTEVNTFLTSNQANLKGSLKNLRTTSAALVADQTALEKTFRFAPLGFQNFANVVDPNAPCLDRPGTCPAVFARLILAPGTTSYTNSYCHDIINTFLPILASLPGLKQINQQLKALRPATTMDALCLAQHAVFDGHNTQSPGSIRTPDLNLGRYLR